MVFAIETSSIYTESTELLKSGKNGKNVSISDQQRSNLDET